LDQNYITADVFEAGYSYCKRIRKMIDGLIRHLKANNNPTNRSTNQPANEPTG
jgi:hypothetical protein